MRLLNIFVRRRLLVLAVVLSCASVVVLGIWRVTTVSRANALCAQAQSPEDQLHKLHHRIKDGVGSEVRFTKADDSSADIKASVESVAQFIYVRSNLKMSDETRVRLQKAEQDTLRGRRARISLNDLVDSFTASVADRVGTLKDEEIEHAANVFRSGADGQITARASGKWGLLSKEEFVSEVKAAREWKQRGDSAVQSSIRPLIEEEVNDRASNLSAAMPEEFGSIREDGITPLQATLIAYSVAADDPLADSQSELAKQIVQERMNRRLTRSEAKAQRLTSSVPFGASGFFHASPVHLVFNQAAMNRLLNPAQGGKGK